MLKKRSKVVVFVIFSLLLIGSLLVGGGVLLLTYYNDLMLEHKNKTYKSTYINNYQISNVDYSVLEDKVLKIKNNTLNKDIVIKYDLGEIKVKIGTFNPSFNDGEVIDKIKSDIEGMSYMDKIKLIKGEKTQNYSLKMNFNEQNIDKFLIDLSNKISCKVKEEKLVIGKDHNLSLDVGTNGYQLNIEKTKQVLLNYLNSNKNNLVMDNDITYTVNVIGEVTYKKKTNLSLINKKISTFATSFNNYGNRAHNITLAVSRVNGTLLNVGDVFSFRQVVGPYTCSNGYKTAPIQSDIGYGCGGGVCQVSTTLYNAQLLAGLDTVMRYNHSYAIDYVPKGQDATVGGDWVDYQFKNQYKYPVYIVSYIENGKVIMDIWSNENALEGKRFVVTSQRVASGGYETYLLTYKEDKLISKKLLHTSYYFG